MTIPDEAVQAAYSAYVTFIEEGGTVPVIDAVRTALTAALPFLQGVEVKALTWREDKLQDGRKKWLSSEEVITETHPSWEHQGFHLFHAAKTFDTVDEAKAAAQADYEARILSAIENGIAVSGSSSSKIEAAALAVEELANTQMNLSLEDWSRISSTILSAIEVAPSPRVQALEEAAQVADKGNTGWLKKRDDTANKKEARDYETMAIACSHVAAAIRALSSQPVADGCKGEWRNPPWRPSHEPT